MTLVNLSPVFEFLGLLVGGPENALIIVGALIKIGLIIGHILGIVPMIIVLERKVLGYVQERPGPNRVGPFGVIQGIADGVKLLMKEDFVPAGADRLLYILAPPLVIIPALMALCLIPWGPIIDGQVLLDFYTLFGLQGFWAPSSQMPMAVTNPNIGILYAFAITSIGVYGITLAGWSSENKWSLLGGVRASAQMISYELSLSLSIIGVLLIAGSLNLYTIIDGQEGWIWNWNVFAQPVGFALFLIAVFAETNRLPFDLAEGEAELTGGFHTEYSSMKFALFFLAEYINMITASAMAATLFFGGYHLIPQEWVAAIINVPFQWYVTSQSGMGLPETLPMLLAALGAPLGLALKIGVFIMIFIIARGSYPRLRYDQIMNLGWKIMLPAGLINLVITAVGVAVLAGWGASAVAEGQTAGEAISSAINNGKWIIGVITLALAVGADRWYAANRRARLASKYKYFDTQTRLATVSHRRAGAQA